MHAAYTLAVEWNFFRTFEHSPADSLVRAPRTPMTATSVSTNSTKMNVCYVSVRIHNKNSERRWKLIRLFVIKNMDYGVATHEFHETIMICGKHQSHNEAILKKDCHISNVGELANRFPFANEPNDSHVSLLSNILVFTRFSFFRLLLLSSL